jgi:Spy/CpxP family protein refolding chaperone
MMLAASLFFVAGFAEGALARPPGGGLHGPHGEYRILDRYADRLGLDDETRAKIEAIVDRSKAAEKELSAQKETARDEMKALFSQELPDEAAVMKQAEEIGAIRTAMRKQFFRTLIDIRKQLTPEQRKQLLAIQNERRTDRNAMREELATSCEMDVANFCPGSETRFERMRCIRDHRDELSPACGAAIEEMKSRRGLRRGGKGPP